ncbi:hypothetical protein A6723_000230 [Pseudomonas sp. AU11447]|uniref:hypothetical protein n=1 Tax=unclassified Pseudomonas TaxID=196821 RepID=UPI0006D488A7|nr:MULTISPECIES: hypothetical protein [unclassified Pseudomonas]OBY87655.1 hypothetical protein A6723_000230 [Pseudomonas sp. AU11447]
MLQYLLDLYEGLKDVYRNRRDPPGAMPKRPAESPPWPSAPSPAGPTPAKPLPASARPVPSNLPALKHWSHPFRDKSDPLTQLTHLSKAGAGYYPVGRNGMWHGGVHFDPGTAGVIDQSSIRCIADGEVVAYRIPATSPKTTYFPARGVTVEAPFASAFVLVRHRLAAPAIAGSTDTPPQLVFYSHYMHLDDWTSYRADPSRTLPAFWRAGSYRVKADTTDRGPLGAAVQGEAKLSGKVLATLPRGTSVRIAYYDLAFFRLESVQGADVPELAEPIRTGRAFMRTCDVERVDGGDRVTSNALGQQQYDGLNIHAAAKAQSDVLAMLPRGAEIVISGEGDYRKLESVIPGGPDDAGFGADAYETPHGYVRLSALEPIIAPQQLDTVVVLDVPIPIKAGELIGHIGSYQSQGTTSPIRKLHLETFTAQNLPEFFEASRAWAQRLPEQEQTWLKLPRGTPVIAPRENGPPALGENGTPCGNDLLVPRSLLDGLPAENKRVVTSDGAPTYNWYRLEGLLNDEDGKPLDGWVCEKIGVMTWVSPWHWEGYDIIHDYGPMDRSLAYRLNIEGRLEEEDQERFRPRIDAWDQGPVQSRLYAIIDNNRDGQLGTDEIRAALSIPARAQSISQLVIRFENEWHYRPQKLDDLDEVFGHTTSTPHLNWVAEKGRVKQLCWWSEVAGKVGLPEDGKVYHLHPIGLVAAFKKPRENTYRIYQDGTIERYMSPEQKPDSARYIYLDKEGVEHDFGVFKAIEADKWKREGMRDVGKVLLIDISDLGSNSARKFGFRFVDTPRKYMSMPALASLIGVLMDVRFNDVVCTGFSLRDGSPGDESKSHINGQNGDFRFLRLDRSGGSLHLSVEPEALDELREMAFIEALYKFGWKQMLAWEYTLNGVRKLLPRTAHYPGHHHHLHVGRYQPIIKDVNDEI